MITAIVRTRLSAGSHGRNAIELFRESLHVYQGVDGLLRKSFILDAENGIAGGVYLWVSREAADKFFTPLWLEQMAKLGGSAPEIMFFDTPIIVDNETDEVLFVTE